MRPLGFLLEDAFVITDHGIKTQPQSDDDADDKYNGTDHRKKLQLCFFCRKGQTAHQDQHNTDNHCACTDHSAEGQTIFFGDTGAMIPVDGTDIALGVGIAKKYDEST